MVPNAILRKKTSRQKSIMGNNDSTITLKTVPKKAYLHLDRMHPETTPENLLQYLQLAAPEIRFDCEQIRRDNITTSFKITYPIEKIEEVYNPKLWPKGAIIRRYFVPRKNFQETSVKNTKK
ncbi:hypothetical protein QE152_g38264 [Popillia japonica]|uniref:Uncharacterized protein n=1 Tax=Popillia japonica TaxID=7064 RepID=A0AAW1I7G0_POPJA